MAPRQYIWTIISRTFAIMGERVRLCQVVGFTVRERIGKNDNAHRTVSESRSRMLGEDGRSLGRASIDTAVIFKRDSNVANSITTTMRMVVNRKTVTTLERDQQPRTSGSNARSGHGAFK